MSLVNKFLGYIDQSTPPNRPITCLPNLESKRLPGALAHDKSHIPTSGHMNCVELRLPMLIRRLCYISQCHVLFIMIRSSNETAHSSNSCIQFAILETHLPYLSNPTAHWTFFNRSVKSKDEQQASFSRQCRV